MLYWRARVNFKIGKSIFTVPGQIMIGIPPVKGLLYGVFQAL
jgi:hypothetical protein